MPNVVTLKKGTWFQMSTDQDRLLGEIVDFQRDEANPDLYWLKCNMLFDYGADAGMDTEKLYSSRDFEGFRELYLYEEDEGRSMLIRALEHTRAREEEPPPRGDTIADALERLRRIIPIDISVPDRLDETGRPEQERIFTGPGEPVEEGRAQETRRPRRRRENGQAEDRDRDGVQEAAREPERVYLGTQGFNPLGLFPTIATQEFKTPLGSGDMKAVLSLYEANPKSSWEAVNVIIQETGHLLLTYTNATLRDKIIQHKVKSMLNTNTFELEVNGLYKLEYDGVSTTAMYLGAERWATHPETCNQIEDLRGKKLTAVFAIQLTSFKVSEVTDDPALAELINGTILPDINPRDIAHYAERGNLEITCIANEEKEVIVKKEIGKNWEKAFVYAYYLGGELDTKMALKEFDDVDSIMKLATAREDAPVLQALAA